MRATLHIGIGATATAVGWVKRSATQRPRAARAMALLVACGLLFSIPSTASACRGSGAAAARRPTMERALSPKPGEISFVGEVITRDRSGVTFKVMQRIQGKIADVQTIVINSCMGAWWGKVGDVFAVVAYLEEDGALAALGFAIGEGGQ